MTQAPAIEIIFWVEEDSEGGYVDRAIGESIFTQGDTLAHLRERVRDAVQCHVAEHERPKLIRHCMGIGQS